MWEGSVQNVGFRFVRWMVPVLIYYKTLEHDGTIKCLWDC